MGVGAVYIRVSTDEQAKFGCSISMQENQDLIFANKNGIYVPPENIYIEDGYTAKNMNRPKLQQLIQDIKTRKKNISTVIVWRIDRLSRNTDDYYTIFKPLFEKYGIELLSATENNDMDNPYGRYIRKNQLNNAELESELTSIRTKYNLEEMARQGRFPGSRPPVGYKRIVEDRRKIIVPDDNAHFIKDIFELYSTGDYSFSEIAGFMAKKGFKHNQKLCSKKLVENILTVYDIFYVGKFNYSGKQYQGIHEPLINIDLYNSFLKARNEKTRPKQRKNKMLYRKLIQCVHSGRFFVGEIQKGGNKSGEYEYYRCHHKCEHCNSCKRIIKSTIIDKAILEVFKMIEISDDTFNNVKSDLKDVLKINKSAEDERKKQIQQQLTKLHARLESLYDDKIDGIIDEPTYMQKRNSWQNQINDLTMEFSALNKTQGEVFSRVEKMLELCKDLSGAYLKHSDIKKRILLKMLCSNFFYDGSKLTITIREPFETLLKFAIFDNGADDGT